VTSLYIFMHVSVFRHMSISTNHIYVGAQEKKQTKKSTF